MQSCTAHSSNTAPKQVSSLMFLPRSLSPLRIIVVGEEKRAGWKGEKRKRRGGGRKKSKKRNVKVDVFESVHSNTVYNGS